VRGKAEAIHLIIHGHFYQPPRENPWLGAIEEQESASPHHDWNERILRECYGPNTRSRILDPLGRVRAIVNNLEKISFNFGPTLLEWLETEAPETYRRILEADRASAAGAGGRGNAIAQAYHHVILPLVPREDRLTLIRWGLADFERRFGRKSEGLWLPETAIHAETAIDLARAGVRYVLLSPHQAWKARAMTGGEWKEVSDGSIDPRRPYRLFPDPKDRALFLDVFFFDRGLSVGISFEHYLTNADVLAKRLAEAAGGSTGGPRLVVVATDGEVYGHHEPFGDMCLAALFGSAADRLGLRATNPAEVLSWWTPEDEVVLKPGPGGEGTAWSCHHGLGRWSRDCGCSIAHRKGWNQAWRAPLREALLALRARLVLLFEKEGARLFADPRRALDSYVDVLGRKSEESWRSFLAREGKDAASWSAEDVARADLLLRMAHESLRMFTSCGWFFDDLAGIEAVQNLLFAGRGLELAGSIDASVASKAEADFRRLLRAARSNVPEEGDGQSIFDDRVRKAHVTPADRAASWAAARLIDAPFPPRLLAGRELAAEEERRARTEAAEILAGLVRVRDPLGLPEGRFRFLAARSESGEPIIWIGDEAFPAEGAFRSRSMEDLRREMHGAPLVLEDLPREFRAFLTDRVLDEERSKIPPRIEALEADLAFVTGLLARTGLTAPAWLRLLLPPLLERRIRRAIDRIVSSIASDEDASSSFRELEEVRLFAERLRVDVSGFLDERSIGEALLASLARSGEWGEEKRAGLVLAVLKGLAGAGFPLRELAPLQDALFERSVGRPPAGPLVRELAGWLGLAPEICGPPPRTAAASSG
jgi:alpha-amylase/alpha-mannosidase (GH57 family)